MEIYTERLILRPWRDSDAESLYEYAKDPRVGPSAGWPVHTSVEDSLGIIGEVLSAEDSYAVTLRGEDRAVGSLGILSVRGLSEEYAGEPEIGYWLGVPYWGRGLIPEAVREVLRILFEERGAKRVWCGHYEGNDKSRRVIEKCGFKFFQRFEADVPLLGERRVEYFYYITKEDWFK
jgi:RimJ/RimL family protein N-acetyltransferase